MCKLHHNILLINSIFAYRLINKTKEKENKMSDNKMKYFEVVQTSIVKANNKTDALKLANGSRNVTGKRLNSDAVVERISASEAVSLISE